MNNVSNEKKYQFLNYITPEIVAVAVSAAILLYVLMPLPLVGIADNGDFARIMNSVCLSHMTADFNENYFGFVSRQFRMLNTIPMPAGYYTTEIPIVAAAVLLCKSVTGGAIFDIRFLSILYIVVFLIAVYLIVHFGRQRLNRVTGWLLAAAVVPVFTDMGYIAYFNTLYGEPVSLIFFLLAVGAALWLAHAGTPRTGLLVLLAAALLVFAGAKVQNSPLGMVGAVFLLGLLGLKPGKQAKRLLVAAAVLVVGCSAFTYLAISPDIKVCNKYQTVFYGILKDSPDPAKDLEELGLNRDLSVLAGTNYFMESYPLDIRSEAFKQELFNKVSHFRIAAFYLSHPERFIGKLEIAAKWGFKLEQGFGNFEKAPGIEYKQTASTFSLWSSFKDKVLPHSLLFVAVFFGGYFFILSYKLFKSTNAYTNMLCGILGYIGVVGLIQFMLPIIGDGEADLSKHLFLFNVSFDMMFVVSVIFLGEFASRRIRALLLHSGKRKPGES